LIFFQKSAPLRRLFFGDTPVSPSLLVKHASSRVLILLHAIYKRKKATKNGGFLCLWSSITSEFLTKNPDDYDDIKKKIIKLKELMNENCICFQ
jgi:hypothetical protein